MPDNYSLDKKKIIFVGNSYTYYGQTVLEKSQKHLTLESRQADKGYFYQLCKRNGMEVEVTNWTFGGHSLDHLFGGFCSAKRGCDGVDHKTYLTDLCYDYVVLQPGSGQASSDNFLYELDNIMKLFRKENPEVRFVLLIPYSAYGKIGSRKFLQSSILNSLGELDEQGVTVVDWGGLVMDILEGRVKIPDSAIDYQKNSFVIKKSEKDGFHPNQLSGYLTTLMTFCAITGKSPVGQPYDFCNDPSLRPSGGAQIFFSFDSFLSTFYTWGGEKTNYPEIFASRVDMAGLQALAEDHLNKKAYRNYKF